MQKRVYHEKAIQTLQYGLLERVLSESFPESVISEIASHLGLEFTFKNLQRRDPNFCREVLRA